jgi:hypothetical protein
MDSIHSIIAVSYYSQNSSEDDAFVVLLRGGLQFVSADASVCDNLTRVNKTLAAEFR